MDLLGVSRASPEADYQQERYMDPSDHDLGILGILCASAYALTGEAACPSTSTAWVSKAATYRLCYNLPMR